ncbi:MAG TPA: zinc-ribbon domain-containing protein [bacterium]|nr:zinc-ribbon domain-containing protein [bacterium]
MKAEEKPDNKCPLCGEYVEWDWSFCPYCGEDLPLKPI